MPAEDCIDEKKKGNHRAIVIKTKLKEPWIM